MIEGLADEISRQADYEVHQKRSRKRIVVAYKNCFDTPAGKIVLADLYRELGVDLPMHSPTQNENDTMHNVGRYSVWQYIRKRLNADDIKISKELKIVSE